MFKSGIIYFFCIGSLLTLKGHSDQKAVCDIWEEDIPVMAHLAVATDGTVLLFREQREKNVLKSSGVKTGECHGLNMKLSVPG